MSERGEWEVVEPDRVLATVLFTDIVGSTAKLAELGDRGWGDLLAEHHARVRRQLARFRGRELDTAGDGVFAEVIVSRTVKDLVAGSGIEFDERGTARLNGVPGEWQLYAVSATSR